LLFVDDELYALGSHVRALREALAGMHIEVEIRNEAGRALEDFIKAVNDGSWKGAILDVMMDNAPDDWEDAGASGELAGLAMAKRLRALEPELPIIFLTNQRDAAVLHEVKRYPNSTYLDKREFATKVPAFVKAVKRALKLSTNGETKQ